MSNLPDIWIDTTTVFRSVGKGGVRPTGIPRVVLECIREALNDTGVRGRIRLCRVSPGTGTIIEVPVSEFDTLLGKFAGELAGPGLRDWLRKHLSAASVDRLSRLEHAGRRHFSRLRMRLRGQGAEAQKLHPFGEGDAWINFGCWWHGDLPSVMQRVRKSVDLRVFVTIHDCMPLIFPEFFPREQVRLWRGGLSDLIETTDGFLVVSDSTGSDVRRLMSEFDGPVHRITLGDSFDRTSVQDSAASYPEGIGLNRPYALLVGTIEARKNHVLAFRTWRALMAETDDLPTLVFAGKWGWKTRDLQEEIADSDGLNGRLRIVSSPTDEELAALYRGAAFTVFPSHYEGWGLPIRESFAFGRLCIAASNSSLVEAGEGLADLFETNCQPDFQRLVRAYLDPARRAEREEIIRRGFKPRPWSVTWQDAKRHIDNGDAP